MNVDLRMITKKIKFKIQKDNYGFYEVSKKEGFFDTWTPICWRTNIEDYPSTQFKKIKDAVENLFELIKRDYNRYKIEIKIYE